MAHVILLQKQFVQFDKLLLFNFVGDFLHHNWCRYVQRNIFGDFGFRFRDTVSVGPRGGSDDNGNFLVASGHTGSSFLSSPIIHQSYLQCSFSFYYYYSSNEPLNDHTLTAMKVYIEMTDIGRRVMIWESSFERRLNGNYIFLSIASKIIKTILFL